MRTLLFISTLTFSLLTAAESTEELAAEARSLVQQFAGQLKPALVQAMQEGGPVHAIEVCADKAPAIAQSLSEDSGWTVRRISLKPRNAETGTPDDWAREILASFDRQAESGTPATEIAHAEVVGDEFRFLKAQPVEPLCLTCHGTNIPPAVRQQLDAFYPNDKAIGYHQGDVRGAFYLTYQLDSATP